MRKKIPVLERIQSHLSVTIIGDLSEDVKDDHWTWQGKLPPLARRKVLTGHRAPFLKDRIQTPPRIRDEDGKIKSVSRILYRVFRGGDYGHSPTRMEGCDFTCVNPFHVKASPTVMIPDIEVKPPDEDADIEGLADEVRDFIAAHGRDENAIRDRFGLDYTDDEITLAIRKINP